MSSPAAARESHLKELDVPFHEAPDKAGWCSQVFFLHRFLLMVWHIINNTIYNASNSDIPAKRASTDEEGITE
uniref:Uncharacterized protein n=1 Tax=Oryza barthii TaxID=65489 RepID=A0A0D3HU92_9ORYZ